VDKEKAEGLLKLKLNGIMQPFNIYGLQDFIPEAIVQITKAAEEFHDNLKGDNAPSP